MTSQLIRRLAFALLVSLSVPVMAQHTTPPSVAVGYFEIPVNDIDRAISFYETVFDIALSKRIVDGYPMAVFPDASHLGGASGALAQGDVYVPGKAGPIIYFTVDDIDTVLGRANGAGAKTLYAKKAVDDHGFVAEFEDSEGNRIALYQPIK